MILKILLIFATCIFHFTSATCITCKYGIAALNTGSVIVRFKDNQSDADNDLTTLKSVGFTAISASDACGSTYNVCGSNSTCNNISSTVYTCDCDQYFSPVRAYQSFECLDDDECANSTTNNCSTDATCTNVSPGFDCACNNGFSGDGYNCSNIDECAASAANCSSTANCTDESPFWSCACWSGYSGDGVNCTDIDECGVTNNCSTNAACNNFDGGYNCTCNSGYNGDGYSCTDIDECTTGTHNCSVNATCTNTDPGFNCECNASYTGDGYTCDDLNECNGANNCDSNATCANEYPGYSCACNPGYTGDGYSGNCTDITECSSDPCDGNANCTEPDVNQVNCTCNTGYEGNGYNCTDQDECASSADNNCHADANCTNTVGSFSCACKSGFTGDGISCNNTDDCAGSNNCSVNAKCIDGVNDYNCSCEAGWSGDGYNCSRGPQSVCFNFTVVCDDLPYNSALADDGSPLYLNVTAALETAFTHFIATVDSTAGFESAAYTWITSTDGLGDGEAEIQLCANNTAMFENDFLEQVDTITESSECGAIASADECSFTTSPCSSNTTCQDTKVGFCCFTEIGYRGNVTINANFSDFDFSSFSTANFTALVNTLQPIISDRLQKREKRGCIHAFEFDVPILPYPGSIVTILRMLLRNTTLTIDDITAELQAAVGTNTSFGQILSAGDFDECVTEYDSERNCSALADCLNFAGDFSCECNATYYDNGTASNSSAGQICINPIVIDCDGSNFSVSILSDYYSDQGISLDALHLADDACNRTTHSTKVGDTIVFSTSINECNTTLSTSSDNSTIIATNYVTNLPTSGSFSGTEIKIPFECELPANVNITAPFNGTVNTVILPSVAASGEFNLEFGLWDDSFGSKYGTSKTFSSNEVIYGQVRVLNSVSNVGVKMDRCWGTPSSSRTDSSQLEYLQDGCSTGAAQQFNMISNGEGPAKFSFQMFFFTEVNHVYLHCDVNVCTPSCKKTCPSRRRRDTAEEETNVVTLTLRLTLDANGSWVGNNNNPFGVGNNNNPFGGNQPDSSVHTITLAVVAAVLAFVLIILLALLVVVVVRKNRASKSHYDMTHVNMHAIGIKPPDY